MGENGAEAVREMLANVSPGSRNGAPLRRQAGAAGAGARSAGGQAHAAVKKRARL
jgi:hypothetical protein